MNGETETTDSVIVCDKCDTVHRDPRACEDVPCPHCGALLTQYGCPDRDRSGLRLTLNRDAPGDPVIEINDVARFEQLSNRVVVELTDGTTQHIPGWSVVEGGV